MQAQVLICQPLIAEARVQYQANAYGNYDGQIGNETVFFRVLPPSSVNMIHPCSMHIHSPITDGIISTFDFFK